MNHQTGLSHLEVYAILVALAIVLLIRLFAKAIKFVAESWILMLVIRHFLGFHYHGERRTDATYWSHGTTSSRKHDRGGWMDRWEHRPIGHRMLWRWALTLAFGGMVYGLIAQYTVTMNAVKSFGVYLLAVCGFVIERKVALRLHNRQIVSPSAKSIAPVLRVSPHAAKRMIHISPEDIKDEGEVGWIGPLPDELTPGPDQQTSVERIISAHLPVDVEVQWKFDQQPRIAVIMAGLRPPPAVSWDSMLEPMAKCAPGDVMLGRDRYKKDYGATFTGLDDPHWGFCVQSGSGKSNFLGIVCAQVLHQDPQATVSVIDPKRVSLVDFLGSPFEGTGLKPLIKGVRMANNPLRPQDMRTVIRASYDLMERRALVAERDRTARFPIHLLVIDELNMFTDIMKTDWTAQASENKAARASDKTIPELPKDDPTWAEIRAILRMGRFTNIHVVVVAQDLRDESFGGKGARNYLGFRGLGSYNKKQYDMLVGTSPYPEPQKGIGRWLFVNGSEKTWVQVVHGDEEKVYAYASYGRELHDTEAALALAPRDEYVHHVDIADPATESLPEARDIQTPPAELRRMIVGIKEAARYLGMKPGSFEKARLRYKDEHGSDIPGTMRKGRSPAWFEEDLIAWRGSRG